MYDVELTEENYVQWTYGIEQFIENCSEQERRQQLDELFNKLHDKFGLDVHDKILKYEQEQTNVYILLIDAIFMTARKKPEIELPADLVGKMNKNLNAITAIGLNKCLQGFCEDGLDESITGIDRNIALYEMTGSLELGNEHLVKGNDSSNVIDETIEFYEELRGMLVKLLPKHERGKYSSTGYYA